MSRAVLGCSAALLGVAVLGACSVLVGSEPEPLRCSDEGQMGPPACDEGQVCEAGICRSAASVPGETDDGDGSSAEGGAAGASGARRRS